MGASGCVSYLFERKGIIEIEEAEEEQLMEVALEAGANDVENQGDGYFVVDCDPDSVQDVRETIEGAGFKIISSAAVLVPTTTAKAEGKEAEQVRRLIEFLEEYDDTDEVSSNAEFDEDEEE